MTIGTIKTKIMQMLDTLPEIKNVFGYPEPSGNGYPYITVVWDRNESEALTNGQDRVHLTYKIKLVQEKIEFFKGRENAETTSDDRTSKIEKLFRDNNDLDLANVLRCLPVNSQKTYDSGATRIIVDTTLIVEIVENSTL